MKEKLFEHIEGNRFKLINRGNPNIHIISGKLPKRVYVLKYRNTDFNEFLGYLSDMLVSYKGKETTVSKILEDNGIVFTYHENPEHIVFVFLDLKTASKAAILLTRIAAENGESEIVFQPFAWEDTTKMLESLFIK